MPNKNQVNLTATQGDSAVFLPALSSFYGTFVGKQRVMNYVEPSRIPFNDGMEALNWLNKDKGIFPYKWALYSAGHADLDVTKDAPKEDMVRKRDRSSTFVLGDSGGFQIGKGVWEGEWKDPASQDVIDKMTDCVNRGTESRTTIVKKDCGLCDNCIERQQKKANGIPTKGLKLSCTNKVDVTKVITVDLVKEYANQLEAADKKRAEVLAWMDAYMDYGMVLDIPAWVRYSPNGSKKSGIQTYQQAVDGTKANNDYFMANRSGECKFLNVLQGENHAEAHDWYDQMKDYCDVSKYPDTHFNGWAMGGQNMCDIHLILLRLIDLHFDGLLVEGIHDWMHFLGTSKLEWAVVLTDIQKAVRKYYNPAFTISFDCASPFLATANGQLYTDVVTEDNTKWSYHMQPSVDDKKYATDNRMFEDVVINDGIFEKFDPSPVMAEVKISDVCHYKPGDLNKNGKEGKTSWDSFSYAIQMGHNVWHHINSVQEANKAYQTGSVPKMLKYVDMRDGNSVSLAEIVNTAFSCDNKEDAKAIIDFYDKFWITIIGTRGNKGKKTYNAGSTLDAWSRKDNGILKFEYNESDDAVLAVDSRAAEKAINDRKERNASTVDNTVMNNLFK